MMAAMSEMNRRDFGVALAALASMGAVQAVGQSGAASGSVGGSKVFTSDLKKMPNGSQRWGVMDGTLATGEAVSMHESIVPAGTPPSKAHVIAHSELIVVVEGTLAFEHDSIVDMAPAGSVIYVASGTNHLVRNAGTSAARYYVLQIGGDTKKG